MLIYLLDLSVVIFVTGILVNEQFLAVDFARKERVGTAYIGMLHPPLVGWVRAEVQAGSDPAAPAAARRTLLDAVREVERLHEDRLGTAEPARLLQQRLATPAAGGASVPATLDAARALLTRVANQSNLILDPDLDSYYTMSLVALRYPELLEVAWGVGDALQGMRTTGAEAGEARSRYLVQEGKLEASRLAIAGDRAEAIAAGGPALQVAIGPGTERLDAAIRGLQAASRDVLRSEGDAASLAELRRAQLRLFDAVGEAWGSGHRALDGLLEARVHGLLQRIAGHLGMALLLLLAILSIVWLVARQIAEPLRHLATVVDEVRRTGRHDRRARWDSDDEIGRLVRGFNDMLGELDQVREQQQRLAAAASAADAELALVHATPTALFVTAIPGHEVLQANEPARRWLHGIDRDPWGRALEGPVRTRFFQQLADRGAVDEFEVRWALGDDPSWAVLSARRVQFNGRDAVLTAFTPVNHLKALERRLRLWAKVFEASSEGILIVDQARRIIAANAAWVRRSGHDLQDLLGESPAGLLDFGTEVTSQAWWEQLVQRGSWQGELQVRHRDGSAYPAWMVASVVRQPDDEVGYCILTTIDITDRKRSEQRIRFLAEHDVLTHLPNRALCLQRLQMALGAAQRAGQKVAVLFIDLDGFKDVNDTLGHALGDALLKSVSRRLVEAVRSVDTVSRLGGDEFVVVLAGVSGAEEVAALVADRLIPRIRAPHSIDGAELTISCSVGAALYPDDADDLDTLMRHADTAMYQAKAEGKDALRFYLPEMTRRTQERLTRLAELRRAVDERQFLLHWQPRVRARDGAPLGVEALLRWAHPQRGLVGPGEFITLAEEADLIGRIGAWVLDEACAQVARWQAEVGWSGVASVNLSMRQLRDPLLAAAVEQALARHGLAAECLELELTESMLMADTQLGMTQLHALRQLGVRVSIDDFGTGYSSLAYLNRLPLDKLKIDRSFVRGLGREAEGGRGAPPGSRGKDADIVRSIIGLGHTLGLQVVGEGVETAEEVALLRGAGCDELQGYHFARPMPASALLDWWQDPSRPRAVPR